MLGQEDYVEIHVMHRQGMSIKAIGHELGLSRNTVRKYRRAAQVPQPEFFIHEVNLYESVVFV